MSLVFALKGELRPGEAVAYATVQVAAAVIGVVAAHLMFEESVLQISSKVRAGPSQWFAEWVATFGLVLDHSADAAGQRRRRGDVRGALHHGRLLVHGVDVLRQPGVTIARSLSDTFAGIRPWDVAPFVLAQLAGALSGLCVCRWLLADPRGGATLP